MSRAHNHKLLTIGLLATTALCAPALAAQTAPAPAEVPAPAAAEVPAPAPTVASARAPAARAPVVNENDIVITATKREESLQRVPISVQAIGTKRLDQLNITNFEQYTKQLPSVSFQTIQPGSTVVYMRGVATGGDGNHSGSLPSVGSYLDEQPITTIGGTLDVHIYDIARIESLAGPQGTLYGASSEAGTIRIITNKPELGVTAGRIDADLNHVSHGGTGGVLEGMINLPVSSRVAFRASAFYQHDAGYIDNIFATRTYVGTLRTPTTITVDNRNTVKNNFNTNTVFGGRAALKIDLDDNWTVTPTILHQEMKTNGVFFENPKLGDLKVEQFFPDARKDKFTQVALTLQGKIANFDLTYAGAYLDRPTSSSTDYTAYTDAYDAYYISLGYSGLLDYNNYVDNAGNNIDPRQHIDGTEHFHKISHEVRLASPVDKPFRVLAGAFYQRQTNFIVQDYLVDNLATFRSVPGYPGTIWLTRQYRVDKDTALFGEANLDLSSQLTLTAGGRLYKYDNSLIGFNGFGPNNPSGSNTGYNRCLTADGSQLVAGTGAPLLTTGGVDGTPCTNVGNVVNGHLVPRRTKGSGFTHRLNIQYKPTRDMMFYATWSRGFRPGGINRAPTAVAYQPDFLTNYEFGWKTTLLGGKMHWNGAIYHQVWKQLQFSFLGPNALTIIQNGRDARINGIESDINYSSNGLTLSAAAAYTDAKTKQNICNASTDPALDCSGLDSKGNPDFIVTPGGTRLPVTPRLKATATARYQWRMGVGKPHIQASVAHQSSAASDIRRDIDGSGTNPNATLGRLHASTTVDAAIGYDWNKMSFELYGTNLFDQRNELSRFVACGSLCTDPNLVVGRPQTFGLRFGYKF